MALVIVSAAKAASRVRRLRRFLGNVHVNVPVYYEALLRQALAGWARARLYLVPLYDPQGNLVGEDKDDATAEITKRLLDEGRYTVLVAFYNGRLGPYTLSLQNPC